jgi:hypothetical protein
MPASLRLSVLREACAFSAGIGEILGKKPWPILSEKKPYEE